MTRRRPLFAPRMTKLGFHCSCWQQLTLAHSVLGFKMWKDVTVIAVCCVSNINVSKNALNRHTQTHTARSSAPIFLHLLMEPMERYLYCCMHIQMCVGVGMRICLHVQQHRTPMSSTGVHLKLIFRWKHPSWPLKRFAQCICEDLLSKSCSKLKIWVKICI